MCGGDAVEHVRRAYGVALTLRECASAREGVSVCVRVSMCVSV